MAEKFVRTKEMDVLFIDYHPYLFSDMRVERSSIPDGLLVYEAAEMDGTGQLCHVARFIRCNFWGTLIGLHELPTDEWGYYEATLHDGQYYASLSCEDYLQLDHDAVSLFYKEECLKRKRVVVSIHITLSTFALDYDKAIKLEGEVSQWIWEMATLNWPFYEDAKNCYFTSSEMTFNPGDELEWDFEVHFPSGIDWREMSDHIRECSESIVPNDLEDEVSIATCFNYAAACVI